MVDIFMTAAMTVGFVAGLCIALTLVAIVAGKIKV